MTWNPSLASLCTRCASNPSRPLLLVFPQSSAITLTIVNKLPMPGAFTRWQLAMRAISELTYAVIQLSPRFVLFMSRFELGCLCLFMLTRHLVIKDLEFRELWVGRQWHG